MLSTGNGMAIPALLYLQPQTDMDPRAGIEAWQDAITALDGALGDVITARRAVEMESGALDRIEASMLLTIEGNNAEVRKAKLLLTLAEDPAYQAQLTTLRAARERLADADRRTVILRERCRLLRATLALHDRGN